MEKFIKYAYEKSKLDFGVLSFLFAKWKSPEKSSIKVVSSFKCDKLVLKCLRTREKREYIHKFHLFHWPQNQQKKNLFLPPTFFNIQQRVSERVKKYLSIENCKRKSLCIDSIYYYLLLLLLKAINYLCCKFTHSSKQVLTKKIK